jgi:beta-glucanase (GH16 family)
MRLSTIVLTCISLFQWMFGMQMVSGQCNELVWADEFDYSGLPDSTKWSYEVGGSGWGNNELEYYTSNRLENASVANGKLTITARLESFGGKSYTSARMVSRQKGDWLYGRIEVSAKIPSGRGTWPAIWMMPTDGAYGGWPNSGEIDIMEHVGFDPHIIHANTHTKSFNGANGRGASMGVYDAFTAFHVYAVDWTPTKMDFYVDDTKYFTLNSTSDYQTWPFDKRFYLIMNIAVGGNWGGAQGVDDAVFPASMVIDYVRVYQNTSTLQLNGASEVFANEKGAVYSVLAEEGRTYNWTVPDGATITSGQGTHSIQVDWGCSFGKVQCHVGTACSQYDLQMDVTGKPYAISGPYFVTNNQTGIRLTASGAGESTLNWTLPPEATLVSGQGTDTLVFNWGTHPDTVKLHIENTCGSYDLFRTLRHYGQYAYPDPESPHEIPGTISPETYDYGGEGVAYHDATPGNAGGGPRQNESVDTEISGSGVDVGWIDAGEWLDYTIKVPVAGTYYFSMLTASLNDVSRGPAKIIVNNNLKLTLYPPNTGSWSVFYPTPYQPITLATTDTLLRIEMGTGGFNLGMISILSHIPTSVYDQPASNLKVYPVPVTNMLHINCPAGARLITVSDLSGRILYSVHPASVTEQDITVDFENFPAGMYIVSLTDKDYRTSLQKVTRVRY